jgi:hypothetical protein
MNYNNMIIFFQSKIKDENQIILNCLLSNDFKNFELEISLKKYGYLGI